MALERVYDLKITALDRVYGNVRLAQLIAWAGEGRIVPRDFVRLAGSDQWTPVTSVPDLAACFHTARTMDGASPPQAHDNRQAPSHSNEFRVVDHATGRQTVRDAGNSAVMAPSLANEHSSKTQIDHETPLDFGTTLRRRKRRHSLEEAEVDMTPMIDVTFQLLIFFMFANQLANPAPIEVPSAVFGRGVNAEGMQMILVDQQGQYYLGDTAAEQNRAPSMDALLAEVEKNSQQSSGDLGVIVNAHKGSHYGSLRELVRRLDGMDRIGEITIGVEEEQ